MSRIVDLKKLLGQDKNVLLLSIALSLLSTIPAPLQSVQKKFAGHEGFTVQFTQEVKQSVFPKEKDEAKGHIEFHRPHHLKWVYESPQPRTIEYDGHQLTVDEGQGKEPVEAKEAEQITGNLEQNFSFLWGVSESANLIFKPVDANHFAVLPKKKSEGSFKRIDVSVKGGFVGIAKVINALDGESILHFRNWRLLK